MYEQTPLGESTAWQEPFRDMYDRAVETYRKGHRDVKSMFSPEDLAFLASVGCKPQELYDFVEDWCEVGEPRFETVLAITTVRREYFLSEQQGRSSPNVISMDSLPSMGARLGEFRWLPRIITKAQAKLRGELPPELMYSCGGDRSFLKKVGIAPAEFLRLVWETEGDHRKILERVEQVTGNIQKTGFFHFFHPRVLCLQAWASFRMMVARGLKTLTRHLNRLTQRS